MCVSVGVALSREPLTRPAGHKCQACQVQRLLLPAHFSHVLRFFLCAFGNQGRRVA